MVVDTVLLIVSTLLSDWTSLFLNVIFIVGAVVLSAFDAKDDAAVKAGTGGLLQVSSYMSWLSGSFDLNAYIIDVSI